MNEYSQDVYQQLINSYDFNGAIDYLKQFTPKSYQDKIRVDNEIRNLQRQASIHNHIQQSMPDGGESFMFASAIENNTPLPDRKTNSYTKQYQDNIDYFMCEPRTKKRADYISITLSDDKALNSFNNKLGVTKDTYSDDIQLTYKNGHPTITVPKNANIPSIIKAAQFAISDGCFVQQTLNTGETVWKSTGRPLQQITINGVDKDGNVISTATNRGYKGIDRVGGHITEVNTERIDGLTFNFKDIDDLYKIAKEKRDKYMADNQTIDTDETLTITPYLGHGHARLHELFSKGLINVEDYKKYLDVIKDQYNTLLEQTPLDNYEVWSYETGDDSRELMPIEDAQKRGEITEAIRIGIANKTLSYSAAMRDGVHGAYIRIAPQVDEKTGELKEGTFNKERIVWVPGLFKSSCDESFNANTKTKAVTDAADMRRWGYDKELSDGSIISNVTNHGGIVKEGDSIYQVSYEEIQNLLNKEHMLDDIAMQFVNMYDDKNNFRGPDTEQNVLKLFIDEAMKELYNKQPSWKVALLREKFQSLLYNKISSITGKQY